MQNMGHYHSNVITRKGEGRGSPADYSVCLSTPAADSCGLRKLEHHFDKQENARCYCKPSKINYCYLELWLKFWLPEFMRSFPHQGDLKNWPGLIGHPILNFPWKVKAAGIKLTIWPTKSWSVYTNLGAAPYTQPRKFFPREGDCIVGKDSGLVIEKSLCHDDPMTN